jgi:hypothetical protein
LAVYALAVAQRLVALVLVHDGLALVAPREVVVAASHQQVRVGEQQLGLLEGAGVAEVEEVEDAVGVDADGAAVDPRGASGGRLLLLAVAAVVAVEHALLGIGDARHRSLLSLAGCVCSVLPPRAPDGD